MALIKWNDDSLFPSINSFFDDFFSKDFFKVAQLGTSIPALNISEKDKSYELELAAPGFSKDDFKIELKENRYLTISSEKKEEKEEKTDKYTKKEFNFSSFSRQVVLPENVETEKIKAEYKNGILKISIPKTASTDSTKKRTIAIES
ncbi:MAG: Hsp20/alpha crystallin family protein [Cytophagales bacterium]|nr:Hsp20/alpha crystallin family protein [Cytophagales bacterium]MDW8385054.1 Hsp20/alpha crystallin family protein [Flammeovirgaceae bacterium]